jgi:hypothetical protein
MRAIDWRICSGVNNRAVDGTVSRKHDHVQFRFQSEKLRDEVEAILIAKAKIEKGCVETRFFQKGKGVRPVLALLAFMPKCFQRHIGCFADMGFVVDDQDVHL